MDKLAYKRDKFRTLSDSIALYIGRLNNKSQLIHNINQTIKFLSS